MMTNRQYAKIGACVRYRKGMDLVSACNDAAEFYELNDGTIRSWKRFKTEVKNELVKMGDWRGR